MIDLTQYQAAAEYIRERIPGPMPRVAVVLGSGLGNFAHEVQAPTVIPYAQIPGFEQSTAIGHKGNLIYGHVRNVPLLAMQGRLHYYEGYSMEQVTFPIRVFALLGIKTLLVSNAAGGINPGFRVGDLMVIRDHINNLPNPLIGPNNEHFGVRFPDMTRTYDPALIGLAQDIAARNGITLHKGVYVGLTGPSYETPAEYRFWQQVGGDAIGMSTIPEVIVARHAGIRVFALSVITNEGWHFEGDYTNNQDEVVTAAEQATETMKIIFSELIASLPQQDR